MVGKADGPSKVLSFGILYGYPRKESALFLVGRLVGCLPCGSHVFCIVLLSVLLSVFHQCLCPLSPCSSSSTQSLSCLLPQHAVTPPYPKGTVSKALPCRPCLLLSRGPELLPGPSPFGSPAPVPPSLQVLYPGSWHPFTTFLLSCPSPRAPACGGREAFRTLFPLFKVSRLVSQEGGLPRHSFSTAQPHALSQPRGPETGERAIPGGPMPLPGEGAAET